MCDKNGISGEEGGVHFGSQFLENPEGRGGHRKNPFRGGGGVWIFSGTTHSGNVALSLVFFWMVAMTVDWLHVFAFYPLPHTLSFLPCYHYMYDVEKCPTTQCCKQTPQLLAIEITRLFFFFFFFGGGGGQVNY